MEIVELRVQVEKSQLDALQAQVKALQGTTINLGAAAGVAGGKGSDPTAATRAGLAATAVQANKTGQSILSVMGKVAKWTAVTTMVYAPIHAFKEAVSTIKALDTEMVNVQKVTGAGAAQMKKFQEQAYQLASQYGRSVTDIAESMTSFARAGYGEQLSQMAELSTLIQNVGYVSADTADSMLLAVDAAWHLGGSQKDLMEVLDGVDKITNQNATDFEKMAKGMTVAASVFAESGESIQTFASLVGTGTAATQRSGEEIARGLRTIMMNIRQIKGETEDGELIDGESIAKASAALKEFAGISTMENGQLRKASDVLADLADKWEHLDSVQQSAISEALAGKRQANVLMAIMGNWDMYEKQMQEYATAAGTALKENAIYMDSWAAKTQQLKSSWVEFVSGFVKTDMMKGALDGLIKAVDFLDSGLGHMLISAGALKLAFTGITKLVGAVMASGAFAKLVELFQMIATFGLGETLGALAATIGPIGIALASIAAIVGGVKLYDYLHVDYDEQIEQVRSLRDEYEALYGVQGEYEALKAKQGEEGGLSAYEQSRLDYLERERASLEENLELERQLALQRYKEQYGSESKYDDGSKTGTLHERMETAEPRDVAILREASEAFDDLTASVKNGSKSREQARTEMQGLLDTYKDFYDEISMGIDLGAFELEDLDPATQEMMQLYDVMRALVDLPVEEWGVGAAIMQFDKLAEVGEKSVYNLKEFKDALADAGASAEDIEGTIAQLQADENVILIDVEAESIDGTIDALKELGIAVEETGEKKVNVEEFAQLADQIGLSRQEATDLATQMQEAGYQILDAEGNAANLEKAFANVGEPFDGLVNSLDDLVSTLREINGLDPINIEADASQAEAALDSVEGKKDVVEQPTNTELNVTDNATKPIMSAEAEARRFDDMRPKPTISVNDQATSTLQGIIGLIASIKDKTVTIRTVQVQQNSPSGYVPTSILRSAMGATSFKGGPTLLGDELSGDGSPRPELVITKGGKAFVAGLAGPTMANIPAGSRIYPYSDTVAIFSGQDIAELQAFSAGNDRALEAWKNRGQAPSSPSTSSGSSGSSGSSSGSRSGSGSGSGSGGRTGGRSSGGGSGGGGGGKTAKEEEDEYLKQLEDELALLKAQYDFLEASGASTDELIAKSGEIQGKLHDINERLRETGGEEKDIVENSTAWYNEQKNIEDLLLEEQEKRKQAYEDERDLLQTISTLMDYQGKSAGERISQLRKIQDNLHREAEYLRSIKASQAEINELSIEWWKIQNDILAIQQDLLDELDAAINEYLRTARKERDAELKILDKQIEKLREERDIQQEQLDIEEKRKAVEEARFALENAQRNRTVRYYNAATGQWEWGADAKNVASAQKTLDQALKDAEDTEKDREFNLRIEALELQKEEINSRYELLEARWETLSESFSDPLRDIKNILADLLASGRLTESQVELVKSLVGDIEQYTADIRDMLSFSSYMETVEGGSFADYLAQRTGNAHAADNFSDSIKQFIEENPTTDWIYTDSDGTEYHSNGSTKTNTGKSTSTSTNSYAISGGIRVASGGSKSSSSSSSSSSTKTATSSSGSSYTIGSEKGLNFVNSAKAGATMDGSDGSKWKKNADGSTTITKNGTSYTVYDEGGVLNGYGGIKATGQDEIVIPPELAKYMLKPSANHQFKQRMAELGFLYGTGSIGAANLAGSTRSMSTSDHYGDVYNYGNITLSENQARNMTVYELAQKSRGLSVYSAN